MRGFICALLVIFSCIVLADDRNHKYDHGEEVILWVNKVGPYHNPQETYDFYSLPFCRPSMKKIRHKKNSLGVILEGEELTDSGLAIRFKLTTDITKVCDLVLDQDDAEELTDAVKSHYWYQLYMDELPIWGMVGEYMQATVDDDGDGRGQLQEQGFIYTHKEFSISYNQNQIIEVNLTSANPRPILAGQSIPMTYAVKWKETKASFENRFNRYLDFDFFEHQIHWFSIFNCFMMVIFLCGLVGLILMRTLRNDFSRYSVDENDMELEHVVDESGWKQVHSDVFRAPPFLVLLSALLGTGSQLFIFAFCVIIGTIVGDFYDDRGSIMTTCLVSYTATSFVAGYSGARFYKRAGGRRWKRVLFLTTVLLPGVAFSTSTVLNFIAIAYGSMASLSATTILMIVAIWLFISCPLVLFGTILGRSTAVLNDHPCRVNKTRRPIPYQRWYSTPLSLVLFSGLLPFGSIFLEVYFIFTSFWNYKFYYVYGFMLLVYLILIVVTVCVSIVSTYMLLNSEDYRWQWTSFLSGASTALYVFMYAIYYFFTKTRMTGIMQTSFYFAYMGMFSLGVFLVCGTIAFTGTNLFVRKIYDYIKSD